MDILSSHLGYSQLITEPTNFEPNKNSSCIDLIFTNQPNIICGSGVIVSLCSSCYHQITYAKINFKVIYPPSYKRDVWHFKRAQTNLIKRRYKKHASGNGINQNKVKLKQATELVCTLISTSKIAYYTSIGEKLNDQSIGSKGVFLDI